ncbi:perlucin-like protein [Limulus polyphemus]|uniref:Perlucin-like protein n=1 Tax=Limulus polyphemus TaxID=6850 RepID=A0ABM1S2N7_LIMPO|nr:perlucin-like protein [Limulus polyphemus]
MQKHCIALEYHRDNYTKPNHTKAQAYLNWLFNKRLVTCKDILCQNGGTCQDIHVSTSSYKAYKCICPWFVTGYECETLLPAHQFCNNSIYWINKDTPRYEDAVASCENKNATVALVTKNETHQCLKSLLTEKFTDTESYFGFYISNRSPSKWISELVPWAASQPSNNDECIVMWVSNNLDWDDTSCTYTELKKGVICEIHV